jgi:glutamate N-acetyltransferase/amino-acid N-acetyltransferase
VKLPQGFQITGINCGLRKNRNDLGLIYCPDGADCAAFFTTNVNESYSVTYSRKNCSNPIKAVIVNSGNANCYSHKGGYRETAAMAAKLAKALKTVDKKVLVGSTGIIGKRMPFEKITAAIPRLITSLNDDFQAFAGAIITTDKYVKISFADVVGKASILGIAKGAGMISPKMATMLAFVMTDAYIPKAELKKISRTVMEESFNAVSVDGCMSTNDTLFVLSSKKVPLTSKSEIESFTKGLKKVCLDLAKMMVSDGEGATKLVELRIENAKTKDEAKKAAMFVANSNLFKCAIYGQDANWGRIIGALGHAGIKVSEDVGIEASDLTKQHIIITIDLKRGKENWRFYTSDLTPEYIKINAEYN